MYLNDSLVYDAVKREEYRRKEYERNIAKQRKIIFEELTYNLSEDDKQYIKSSIINNDMLRRYGMSNCSYENCIKYSIENLKINRR